MYIVNSVYLQAFKNFVIALLQSYKNRQEISLLKKLKQLSKKLNCCFKRTKDEVVTREMNGNQFIAIDISDTSSDYESSSDEFEDF